MTTSDVKQTLRLSDPVPSALFDAVVEKLSPKDRAAVTKFIEAPRTTQALDLWKRVFCVMAALAPHAIQTTGKLSVRFYVSDGKHRLQIFGLEDSENSNGLHLYIPDALAQAIDSELLLTGEEIDGVMKYPIRDANGAMLQIDPLTERGTVNAPELYKHMLGWNRKAIRVVLPTTASPPEIHSAEILCVLGAALRSPEGAPSTRIIHPKPAAKDQ